MSTHDDGGVLEANGQSHHTCHNASREDRDGICSEVAVPFRSAVPIRLVSLMNSIEEITEGADRHCAQVPVIPTSFQINEHETYSNGNLWKQYGVGSVLELCTHNKSGIVCCGPPALKLRRPHRPKLVYWMGRGMGWGNREEERGMEEGGVSRSMVPNPGLTVAKYLDLATIECEPIELGHRFLCSVADNE